LVCSKEKENSEKNKRKIEDFLNLRLYFREEKMNIKRGCLFIAVMLILFMSLVSASFDLGNLSHEIEKNYGPGDNIKGWLNMSFDKEPGDNIFTSNFNGNISLMELLNNNSVQYDCIPSDCKFVYNTMGEGSETKNFDLDIDEKVFGLRLDGEIENITGLSFDISVTNQQSCNTPLRIDILNDDVEEWRSEILLDNYVCTIDNGTGCFNDVDTEEAMLGENIYCEKINLTESKNFSLGAWIRKGTTTWESGLFVMQLYDLEGVFLDSCELAEENISTDGGEVSCMVGYENQNPGQGYYVCINVKKTTDYKIKKENEEPCGFYGSVPPTEYKNDYYIFARGAKFGNIGSFTYNQQKYEENTGGSLAGYLYNYMEEKTGYTNNCTEGCVFPIAFIPGVSQSIDISNISLSYTKEGHPQTPETKIYDLTTKAAKVSSGFLILNLDDSGIEVPEDYGSYNFTLYFKGTKILSEEIEVRNIPIIENLHPKTVSAAVPTKFIIFVSSPANRNITSYKWDFGDNETETTTENYVIHAYNSTGNYFLKIEVEDSAGLKASKSFDIEVKSPKELANSTISNYKGRLSNITSELAAMPSWYGEKIRDMMDVDGLVSELNRLERAYNSASSDDEYTEIMANLLDLKIPISIRESAKGNMPFFVDVNDIQPGYFKELGAGSYQEDEIEEYKRAIAVWSEDSINAELEFSYISAYYDNYIEEILSIFKLKINTNEDIDKGFYIVIEDPAIILDQSYDTKEFIDALGIKFPDIRSRNIGFASSLSLEELAMYWSPDFIELKPGIIEPCDFNGVCEKEKGEDWHNCRADCKPWGWVVILLIALIFSALIAYIILQWWYKKKYESYLFKNKNDLYNLLTFMTNAKSRGMTDSEIRSRLKKAGWKGEQVTYAFKKLRGQAIMPLDFLKLFKKFSPELKNQDIS
jgi:hypothetical protein